MSSTVVNRSFIDPAELKRWMTAVGLCVTIVSAAVVYRTLPASTVKAGPSQVLSLEHQSFARSGVTETVHLRVRPSQGQSVRLVLDEQFSRAYMVEHTTPMAKTVRSDGGGKVLTFDAPADSDLAVRLAVRPLSWGQQNVTVRADVPGVVAAQSTISQFVLP